MFVPTAAKKSHRVPDQALTFGGRKTAEVRLLRFWDFVIPISGRGFAELTSEWKLQQCFCAFAAASVHYHQRTSVRFRNLTAQRQTNPRALGLCGEKWHEQIRRVHDSGSFVLNKNLNRIFFLPPADYDVSARLKRGINGIAHQINQQLFEL